MTMTRAFSRLRWNMLRKILFVLLVPATLWAAQPPKTVSIPVGNNVYGPVSVNQVHKYANIILDRDATFTNLSAKGKITINFSFDNGSTFPEHPFCQFIVTGAEIIPDNGVSALACPLPTGATHIKATTAVVGGPIILTTQPNLRSKE